MASYDIPNFTNFLTRLNTSDTQEVKWKKSITLQMRGRANPLYDYIGGIGEQRPILELVDFGKLDGQEIVLTMDRPLGGAGVQGSTTLIGSEEKEYHSNYRAKIGHFRHAVATDKQTKEQTVIGSQWDQRCKKKLAEFFAWKMSSDILFEMEKRKHSNNTFYADGVTSRDSLKSANYLKLGDVSRAKSGLVSLQAEPFSVKKSNAGADIWRFTALGSQYSFDGMHQSNSYQNLLSQAGERGDKNYLFAGGFPTWDNTWLHEWQVEDGTQIGPKACLGAPRAYLGAVIPSTATTTAQTIKGGGTATFGALTAPLYFQNFSNAQYVGHEGEKIAADTTTMRYLAVVASDTGKIAIFSYQVNNGNQITQVLRLAASTTGAIATTVGSMTYGSGVWTSSVVATEALPVGSRIYEVNANGQPFVRTWVFGKHMMVTGWGSLDGGARHGERIQQVEDYGNVTGLGWRQIWGCRAVENADNVVNGYAIVESAYNPPGWPTIV